MLSRTLAALFPSTCGGCGRAGSAFCATCAAELRGGRTLFTGDLGVRAIGNYSGALRRAVLAYKGGRRDVGEALGQLLAERCGALPAGSVLVPVPTTRRRRGERGFDQSVLLAESVGTRHDLPVLDALRQCAGDAQRGRSRARRLMALGRFECRARHLVAGVRVVLVDDVVTTGTTLRDCAGALRDARATVDAALVLAYA